MDGPLDLRHHQPDRVTRAGIGEMLSYWQSLRGSNLVPARTQIDPLVIQPYLGRAAVAERTHSGNIRIRLAGKHLHDLMGMEPRGMPLRALFEVGARRKMQDLMEAVFEGPKLLTMSLVAEVSGATPITGQMAVMPLTDMECMITRALIMLVADPTDVPGPFRFKIRSANLSPLNVATQIASMAPKMRALRPTRVRVQRGESPYLRVIEGGLT